MKKYLLKSLLLFGIVMCYSLSAQESVGLRVHHPEYHMEYAVYRNLPLPELNSEKVQNTVPTLPINPYASARKASGGLFLLSYSATVLISGVMFRSPYTELYIPVIGPFLAIANKDNNLGQYTNAVWLAGISQSLTAVMYFIFKVSADDWEYKHKNLKMGIDLDNPGVYLSFKF